MKRSMREWGEGEGLGGGGIVRGKVRLLPDSKDGFCGEPKGDK